MSGRLTGRQFRLDGRIVTWMDLAEVNEPETMTEIGAIAIGETATIGQADVIERLPDFDDSGIVEFERERAEERKAIEKAAWIRGYVTAVGTLCAGETRASTLLGLAGLTREDAVEAGCDGIDLGRCDAESAWDDGR